jgi:hypothetical protein
MSELHLNSDQESLIARLAALSGRSQADILNEASAVLARELEEHDQWMNAQAAALTAVWDNDDDAVNHRLGGG